MPRVNIDRMMNFASPLFVLSWETGAVLLTGAVTLFGFSDIL